MVAQVMVVDDHQLFTDAVATALEATGRYECAARAADAASALSLLAGGLRPAAILVDMRLPDMPGNKLLGRLRGVTDVPLVVVSAFVGRTEVEAALQAGANGYVSKEQPIEALVGALDLVLAGLAVLPMNVLGDVVTSARADVSGGLTPREAEVLRLVAEGRSNGEIAASLGVSVNTVRNHMHRLMTKLNARSRSAAVRSARERGLLAAG